MSPTRVFTGLKPTGSLQVGNYLGAVRPLLALTAEPGQDVLVSIADLHALTVDHDPQALRARTTEMAATLLACGLDPSATLFVQSQVPAHTELAYLLESTATYGEMARMVQFKDKSAGRESVRLSLLTYPALMAADILAYQTQVVPVGEDQRQHLELTRTVARRFNRAYGEVFTVPRGITPASGARVMDLRDPRAKMGKSGADGSGVVFLLDDPDVIAAKVRRATTDPDPVLDFRPGARPGVANLAVLLGALTGQEPEQALVGLHGGGGLKAAVTEALVETLTPIRRAYAQIVADPRAVEEVLEAGAARAADLAGDTVASAKEVMGLLPTPRVLDN